MPSVSFNGLASGLDTASLVKQLVAVERSGADSLTTKQGYLSTQSSIVSTLSSTLAALGAAVKGMDLTSELQPRTATSSDAHVSIAASTGAPAGSHNVRVIDTAATQVVSSRTFATSGAGVLGAGSVTITKSDGSNKIVSWTAADSLADVAARLGDANAGVRASVLNDGTAYRLVVSAAASGTAGAVTFSDAGSGLDLSNAANVTVPPRDAELLVDGITITRSTNVIDDALAGMTITLGAKHAATDLDTVVGVELDRDALKTKLKDFVTKYNAINSAVHYQLDYFGTKKGPDTLFGDSTLRQLQGAMNATLAKGYDDMTLGSVGVTRDKTGALTLDETKFADAIGKDPDVVNKLFVTGGFAAEMTKLVDNYSGSGGIFAEKTASLSARKRALQTTIDRINANADKMQVRLENQFTRLEQAMSALQSQNAYLTSVLGG
jgi:flagellar hook-associated protein 2